MRGGSSQSLRCEGFAQTLIVGEVSEDLLGTGYGSVEKIPWPQYFPNSDRLPVAELLALGQKTRREAGAILVLTNCDLAIPECESLLGFADRREGIAVVSLFRLHEPSDSNRLKTRLQNEIAHELGHLQGYQHCKNSACVMHAIQSPSNIDTRPDRPCGRCPTTRSLTARIMGSLIVCVFFALLFVGLDLTAPLFGPAFDAPFT